MDSIFCPMCGTRYDLNLDRILDNQGSIVVIKCLSDDCGFRYAVEKNYLLSFYGGMQIHQSEDFLIIPIKENGGYHESQY